MNRKNIGDDRQGRCAALCAASAVPETAEPRIGVVIPAYRAASTICGVIGRIGPLVTTIYVVDDECPEASGDIVLRHCRDRRVVVLRSPENRGVGGAMKLGYAAALNDGMEIIVKLDADGQMDPAHIPLLVRPVASGVADYAKSNRFASETHMPSGSPSLASMPPMRRLGNAFLSILHKGVTGYWDIADPASGYTAIHRHALERISMEQIADGYFFETDVLFQLNLINAVVEDVPLPARYGGEVSTLRISRVVRQFPALLLHRMSVRILRKYVQRLSWPRVVWILATLLVTIVAVAWDWSRTDVGEFGSRIIRILALAIPTHLVVRAIRHDVRQVPRQPISVRDSSGTR